MITDTRGGVISAASAKPAASCSERRRPAGGGRSALLLLCRYVISASGESSAKNRAKDMFVVSNVLRSLRGHNNCDTVLTLAKPILFAEPFEGQDCKSLSRSFSGISPRWTLLFWDERHLQENLRRRRVSQRGDGAMEVRLRMA